jgi:predicted GTPase
MSDENLNKIVELVMKAIEKLPDPPRELVKKEMYKIKEIIMDNRPPRILILGRRGAGKSSLINALFKEKVAAVGSVLSETGAPEWHTFKNSKGSIEILDTRGMGDRTKPESANFEEAIEDIKSEVKGSCPDVVLFLCKAKEVDAHINNDIENVRSIKQFISDSHGYEIPIAALLTQVDELDPKRVEPPYENSQKKENIHKAVRALQDAFNDSHMDLLKIIPISAYAEYDNGNRKYDNFWNIDLLIDYLIEALPKEAQLQLARLSALKKVQCKLARTLVGATATICAGIAATPIPLADVIPITMAQVGMIIGIAYIAGRELSKESAKEFLVALGLNVGAGFAVREGARALIKFVFPGVGNVVSAGMAFAGTWGIGEAAIAYFINGASIEETKLIFKKAKEEHDKKENG